MKHFGYYLLVILLAVSMSTYVGCGRKDQEPKQPANETPETPPVVETSNGNGTNPVVLPVLPDSPFEKARIKARTDASAIPEAAKHAKVEDLERVALALVASSDPPLWRITDLKILASVEGISTHADIGKAIMELLKDPHKEVRIASGQWLLETFGSTEEVVIVVLRLGSPGLQEKQQALDSILKKPNFFPFRVYTANALLDELSVEDAAFHYRLLTTIIALGIESDKVVAELIETYRSKSGAEKTRALDLMITYADKSDKGIEGLKSLYNPKETQPTARSEFISRLAESGNVAALSRVFDKWTLAEEKDRILRKKVVEVLYKAIKPAKGLGDKDSLGAMAQTMTSVMEANLPARPGKPEKAQRDDASAVEMAAVALGEIGTDDANGSLIEHMYNQKTFIARTSWKSLKALTGQSLPFDPLGPTSIPQIQRWSKWWADSQGG